MELYFIGLLVLLMAGALAMGYPVAFALPGSAILTIAIASLVGWLFTGDTGSYFAQDGPIQWLTAGVTNFRGVYWEVERDTLIAIPLFVFMGIMLQRSKIANIFCSTVSLRKTDGSCVKYPIPRKARFSIGARVILSP